MLTNNFKWTFNVWKIICLIQAVLYILSTRGHFFGLFHIVLFFSWQSMFKDLEERRRAVEQTQERHQHLSYYKDLHLKTIYESKNDQINIRGSVNSLGPITRQFWIRHIPNTYFDLCISLKRKKIQFKQLPSCIHFIIYNIIHTYVLF